MTARPQRERAAEYVESVCQVSVRFQEVDVLGVVWHGHYLTYFELGRVAFGREYRFDYLDIHAAGLVAPLVDLDVHYMAPARYGDTLTVRSRLMNVDGAQVRFEYVVEDSQGKALATGRSRQVFLDLAGNLLVIRPPILEDLLVRCRPFMRPS